MKRGRSIAVGGAIVVLAVSSVVPTIGMPPPPAASEEEVLCKATLVFVGTADNFRIVRASASKTCDAFESDGKHLSPCEAVEVTVSIQETIYREASIPPSRTVEFRFGGGLFSVDDLRRDLVGKQRLFHVVADGQPSDGIYVPSYPWRLGGDASYATRAKEILGTCER